MIRRWLMWLFGSTDHRRNPQLKRLRKLEEKENRAIDRVVDAGVRATLQADKSSEHANALTEKLIKREETDKAILTADRLLRFLEGKPP